jgi:alkylation response protein AidB-like acyl-CoA dehydrogenase
MIDLLPSAEQQQIIDSVVEFFERALPVSRLRAPADSWRIANSLWKEIAGLGWFGLALTEEQDGAGYSLIEEMLVARECGRHVASPALIAAMLAAHVAARAGKPALVEGILSGELRVGLANALPDANRASEFHLLDADGAHLVLYWNDEGMGLHERTAFEAGTAVESLDEAVHLVRVTAPNSVPSAWVSAQHCPLPRRAALLICAQLVGVAEAAKDDAVAYAKTREQFGQPIGAFQALKHECAEMAVQCEAAYAQTFFAGLTENSDLADAEFQGAVAVLLTTQAALHNARANIQIHGGIGFTSECDAHRYLKRAHLLGQLGGGMGRQQRRLLLTPLGAD